MRVGALIKSDGFNVFYRALGPLSAVRDLGHDIEVVEQRPDGGFDAKRLLRCDAVHVYRRADPQVLAFAAELHRRGIGLTWDNDDDIRRVPKGTSADKVRGATNAARDFQAQVKMMRAADMVTTPSPVLAETYREAGARDVRVIENHLMPEQYASGSRKHDGLVIGWVAGLEHEADAAALDIAAVLRRVMERRPEVRVITFGVRLALDPARYEHRDGVELFKLKDHLRYFDVGIAPLADIPMSYARSSVKVKEYAAAGIPWLASARGPYEGLGPKQGGELVPDDGWEQALDDMLGSRFKRFALRRSASAWGKQQAGARHAGEWLAAFEAAIASADERRALRGPVPAAGLRR